MVKGSSKSVEDRLLSPQLQKFAHSSLLQRSQTLLLGAVNLFWVISREEKDYRQEPNAIDPDTIRDLLVVAGSIATSTGTKPLSMRQWQSMKTDRRWTYSSPGYRASTYCRQSHSQSDFIKGGWYPTVFLLVANYLQLFLSLALVNSMQIKCMLCNQHW